jgi:aminopeptidase YwaD
MQVVKHIYSLLEQLNKTSNKLVFAKTKEPQLGTTAQFSVTLGVMPDYTFSGKGLRIDGVSSNRPAEKAGLKTGDVITALGNFNVNSIEAYMQALSNYKKGEKTIISFERGNETLQTTVEF